MAVQDTPNNLNATRGQTPNLTRAALDQNVNKVPEQIARLEGIVDGIKHSQTSILGAHNITIAAVALAFAIMIGGFTVLFVNASSIEAKLSGRIDLLEQNIARLPDQLVAIAAAINGRQPPAPAAVSPTPTPKPAPKKP